MKRTYLHQLATTLSQLNTSSEVMTFLKGILTPKEIEEISVRLQIVKQLKQGVAQREIAENLGVGIATVTRGSKELHKGNFKNV